MNSNQLNKKLNPTQNGHTLIGTKMGVPADMTANKRLFLSKPYVTHTRARACSITAGLGSFPQEQRHKLHVTTRDSSLGVSFPSRTRRGIREGTLAVGAWLLAPATPVFLTTRREMG